MTATIASAVRSGCQPPGMASSQIAKRPSPPPGALAVAGELVDPAALAAR